MERENCLFPKSSGNVNVVKIIQILYFLFSTIYIACLLMDDVTSMSLVGG